MQRTSSRTLATSALVATLAAAPGLAQPATVDAAIAPYAKASGVSGNLSSVGSDTLNNLMTFWAEGFQKQYPNVRIQIEGKGSSTAPPSLIAGTSQLGPMSRAMKAEEIDEFEKKYGYAPSVMRVAVDGLAIWVNRDNPIEQLTLQQIDGIFSKTRKSGGRDVKSWGDLGLTGEWAAKPLSLYGRNSASGTYGFFKEHALANGDFKDTVKEQPGSASVVQGVTEDKFGIGYSGIGYRTSGVKPVSVAGKDGKFHTPGSDDVLSGRYPLARYLYVYYNAAPNRPLDPLVREFLRFATSRDGQEIVVKDGYLPSPAKVSTEEQGKLR
jgi:phosphate transport system substrate-binding protein